MFLMRCLIFLDCLKNPVRIQKNIFRMELNKPSAQLGEGEKSLVEMLTLKASSLLNSFERGRSPQIFGREHFLRKLIERDHFWAHQKS